MYVYDCTDYILSVQYLANIVSTVNTCACTYTSQICQYEHDEPACFYDGKSSMTKQ